MSFDRSSNSPGSPSPDESARFVRVSQVLVAAFILGMTSFGLASLIIAPASKPSTVHLGGTPIRMDTLLIAVGAIVLVGGSALGLAFRSVQLRSLRRDADRGAEVPVEKIGQAFVSTTIVRAAILEGAGLLGAVTTFITGSMYGLVLLGAAVAFMAFVFPTRSSLEAFTRDATGRAY